MPISSSVCVASCTALHQGSLIVPAWNKSVLGRINLPTRVREAPPRFATHAQALLDLKLYKYPISRAGMIGGRAAGEGPGCPDCSCCCC